MPSDIVLRNKRIEVIGEKVEFCKDDKPASKPTVVVDAVNGDLEIGGNNKDGDLLVRGKSGKRTVEISAEVNAPRDERTIYINGQTPSIEIKSPRKAPSGVFPKITLGPTSIECKVNRGLPKFKITDKGTVFTTQVSFMNGAAITIARDITISAKVRGTRKTVNVHKDIVALKAQIKELQQQIAALQS